MISRMTNFWIVAIDHGVQLIKAEENSESLVAQKQQLENLLKMGFVERHIDFIAEESKDGKATIASELASSAHPQIPWINIMMTIPEER